MADRNRKLEPRSESIEDHRVLIGNSESAVFLELLLNTTRLPKDIADIVAAYCLTREQINWLDRTALFQRSHRTHDLLKKTALVFVIVEFIQTLLGFLHWRWCGYFSNYLVLPILSLCCLLIVIVGLLNTYDGRKSVSLKALLQDNQLPLEKVEDTELVFFERNLVSFFNEMLNNFKCYRIFFGCSFWTAMVSLILNFMPSDSPDSDLTITLKTNAVIGFALLSHGFYRMEKTKGDIQSNLEVLDSADPDEAPSL